MMLDCLRRSRQHGSACLDPYLGSAMLALSLLPLLRCDLTVPATPGALHAAAAQLAAVAASPSLERHVCLLPGDHLLQGRSLRLGATHNDRQGARVRWRAADPARPASEYVVRAGVALTRWERCGDAAHCGGWDGVWAHPSEGLANVSAEDVPFRQLWVGGRRAARVSRTGASLGLRATAWGYVADEEASEAWAADQVELRWPSQIQNWIEPRCVISAVSGANLTVAPECWASLIARNGGELPPPPLFVENIATPPGPGQFYASAQYIYYRPEASDPYAPPTDAWVPLGDTILEADSLVNHSFEGLTFAHATWRQPSAAGGYVPSQSLVTPHGEPQGAVRFTRARGLLVDRCSFAHVGAAYALSIGGASQDVVVRASTFADLSGGALKLGNVDDARALSTDPDAFDARLLVEDNVMQGVAVEFRGAAAVFAGYVAQTSIRHNSISDCGYTGISLGWGWGTHVQGPQTFAADNEVSYNRLTGVMSALNDGGCTYTLGPQPRSRVEYNFCSADNAPVVGCFYHDNGSRYFTTKGNVAQGSPAPCVYLQGCCNSPAYDIAVSDLWCRSTGAVRNGCAAENCTIDNSTLYIVPADSPWPPEAQAIVNVSGARLGQRDDRVPSLVEEMSEAAPSIRDVFELVEEIFLVESS